MHAERSVTARNCAEPRGVTRAGSLLEMLMEGRPQNQTSRRKPASDHEQRLDSAGTRYRGAQPPKRLFLTEFEICGSVSEAARIAGCSAWEVHQWRAADRMFARDFTLAALAHVKAMKHMVQEVRQEHVSLAVRAEAQNLLNAEGEFIGSDGRLDLGAWRDRLKDFLDRVGFKQTDWEPKLYPE
jgi:hypothetical protein